MVSTFYSLREGEGEHLVMGTKGVNLGHKEGQYPGC